MSIRSIFLLIAIAFCACENFQGEGTSSHFKLSSGLVHINIDEHYMSRYLLASAFPSEGTFVGYNQKRNKLDVFDLTQKIPLQEIDLQDAEKWGFDNANIQYVRQLSNGQFLLVSTYRLLKVDSAGNVVSSLDINHPSSKLHGIDFSKDMLLAPPNGSVPELPDGSLLFWCTPYSYYDLTEAEYYTDSIVAALDWEEKKVNKLPITYPDFMNENQIFPFQQAPMPLVLGDTIYYSFKAGSEIFYYVPKNGKKGKVSPKQALTADRAKGYTPAAYRENPTSQFYDLNYYQIIYDPARRFFFRVAAEKEDGTEKTRNFYLSVYGRDLKLLHEEKLPPDTSPVLALMHKEGIFMPVHPLHQQSEDQLSFRLFKLIDGF